ncbi:alpha/beta hydrolase [Salinimicrobium sp. CAU 1759]
MKRLLLLVALLVAQHGFSQMDEKFYFPSKEWKSTEGYDFEEILFYPGQDTLSTILMSPKNTPKASILYFHGSGGNVTSYIPHAQALVDGGYQVFMVDFRGYGNSSGEPTHVNIASDAEFLLQEMRRLPAMEDQEILVYGSSMGTQVAINLASKHQEKIIGLVLDGAMASFTDIALQYAPPAAHPQIKAQKNLFPYTAKEDITQIKDLPILFIHSKEDKEVSFEQGKMLFELAVAPKSLWIYEGDHLQAPILFPEELVSRIDKLLED